METSEKPIEKKPFFTLPKVSIGLGIGTFGGWLLEPELVRSILTIAWREQFFKMLIAFTLAGVVHRMIFKRDIEKQLLRIVDPIIGALNKIGDRLNNHDDRLGSIEEKLTRK